MTRARWILAYLIVLAPACATGDHATARCKDPLKAGDLVITEVFASFKPAGHPGKQWIEIYNAADRPISLEGLTITRSKLDGSSPISHVLTATTLAPGQFFTAGDATQGNLPAYVDYGYGTDLGDLGTDGTIALKCSDSEIDTATYEAIQPGHSRELTSAQPPSYLLNDDPSNWCQGNDSEFDSGNFGTPGQNNDCVPIVIGQCNNGIGMRDAVVPQAGDLVITEVMPGPLKAPASLAQWFELKAINPVDLNGLAMGRVGTTNPTDKVNQPDCIHVAAGSYFVFAKTQDTTMNGGVPPGAVLGTFTFSLTTGTSGDLAISVGSSVVDSIGWSHSTPGKALQLEPNLTDPISNDMETNFCDAVSTFGAGDLGTPGAANAHCASQPTAGMCDDNGTPRAIVKPAAGKLVISEVMPNPSGDETKREWFEITNIGTAAFDLNELGLDRDNDTRPPDVIHAASCKRITPGGFALFSRSIDSAVNAGLPPVDATFGFTMVNSSGNVEVVDGTTVLDRVSWTTTMDGVSRQLSSAHFSATENDVLTNFCAGTAPYGDGTNHGTPRAPNYACP